MIITCQVAQTPPANAGDAGDLSWIPGLGRSPGVGNGNPLQYSCLENSMDRGAWWATVHGVMKSQTRLNPHSLLYITRLLLLTGSSACLQWTMGSDLLVVTSESGALWQLPTETPGDGAAVLASGFPERLIPYPKERLCKHMSCTWIQSHGHCPQKGGSKEHQSECFQSSSLAFYCTSESQAFQVWGDAHATKGPFWSKQESFFQLLGWVGRRTLSWINFRRAQETVVYSAGSSRWTNGFSEDNSWNECAINTAPPLLQTEHESPFHAGQAVPQVVHSGPPPAAWVSATLSLVHSAPVSTLLEILEYTLLALPSAGDVLNREIPMSTSSFTYWQESHPFGDSIYPDVLI